MTTSEETLQAKGEPDTGLEGEHYEEHKEIMNEEERLMEYCEKYEITPILYRALFNGNPKDRYFILRLERDLHDFILSINNESWRLQPLNSYYRLLVHQIAAYYKMGHILLKDGASMVIFKNNTSIVNGNIVDSQGNSIDHRAKLNKLRLMDIPNELYVDVEVSNDISDEFLIKNNLYSSPVNNSSVLNGRGSGKVRNGNHNYNSADPNKPFRIIKRKNDDSTQNNHNSQIEDGYDYNENEQDKHFNVVDNENGNDNDNGSALASLEDERLSKEELYNRTREKIFQNNGEEVEDEEYEQQEQDVDVEHQEAGTADEVQEISEAEIGNTEGRDDGAEPAKHRGNYYHHNHNNRYTKSNFHKKQPFRPFNYYPTTPYSVQTPNGYYPPYGYYIPQQMQPPVPPSEFTSEDDSVDSISSSSNSINNVTSANTPDPPSITSGPLDPLMASPPASSPAMPFLPIAAGGYPFYAPGTGAPAYYFPMPQQQMPPFVGNNRRGGFNNGYRRGNSYGYRRNNGGYNNNNVRLGNGYRNNYNHHQAQQAQAAHYNNGYNYQQQQQFEDFASNDGQ